MPSSVVHVEWDEFASYLSHQWHQGEHVAIVGPTGRGKTTLALAILPIRTWVCIVATKPKDSTLAGLTRRGWRKIKSWPPPPRVQKVILWPAWRGPGDTRRQANVIYNAMNSMYAAESWCLFVDDLQYVMQELGLSRAITTLLHMARSLKVSLVLSTQRPRHVPLSVWSQSTHLFIFGTQDHEDLRRLGGLGGLDARIIRDEVASLDRHGVLYVNTRTGHLARTQSPPPGRR